ncbi:TonB-linked SusC/RagA family outer membrane protein [Dysgonomonas sp. PFB1-18]|uniref:SusC/RagA family TonB-linked outer membrane protein n=2 Tax=Dysgonomonas TaxID=156973 RepID=UPI002476E2E8|nr:MULTISPECIES: TonB-dependent receptor [unclassified Dysgonomonas]MDH6338659.1 TonB-linked SusC/RagA family outer membrane protein [Dysgonomonas sp. PF1-16]MDH6380313.1 TonB-linked SusC/RagA family outer membrane protein [Dysgonomonas sp. PFB1-18]MDH6397643.1 TonB-linked SusC/RagA family outer membrane protein [Dysgonomonas sp. PF1-23]
MKITNLRKWTMTILAFIMSVGLYAQQLTIKGKIVDETDSPLIGATVSVVGKTVGVSADTNGEFSIKAARGETLQFSYLGYVSQSLKITNQNSLVIRMEPKTSSLDEVVVVGYGTMRRSDLTGSVASVGSENIEGYKTSSVLGALGGQVAGVQISQFDGTPGSGFNVNIRGVGTLTGDASPLYIVDGFEVSSLDYLANSDIESVEILKDASASAIYGARAANGVVLVTTKSGKIGRPVVTYNGSASYRNIYKKLDMLSTYEFVKLQGDINTKYIDTYYKEGVDDDGNPHIYQSLDDYVGVQGINWQDETFRSTWSQDHNVTINGGIETTKYNFSFNRYTENGIFTNSGFDKTSAKFKINQTLTKNLRFDATINYALTNRKGTGTTADNGRFNMLAQILSARPTGGLKIDDYTLLTSAIDPVMLEDGTSLAQVNPILQAQNTTNDRRAELWSANLSVTWDIVKGLSFRTAGTYNTTNTRNDVFYKLNTKEAFRNGKKPYGQTQMGRNVRWTNYNNLTWKQTINKKHKYDVMLGQELSYNSNEYLLGQAMDFPFDNLGNDNLGIGAIPSRVTTDLYDKKLLSFFARANYSYDNRYLFTGTIRADGSTVFSKNHKWGYFPSFSAAWRVSEEAFMKDIKAISNLKLRVGWGVVGNDRISNYLSLDLYQINKYGVGTTTQTVLTPKQLKNEDLKWEGSSTINAGIDLSLFNNRLNITSDFFIKDTKDLLLAQSLAHVTGFTSQYQNIGKIRNKGIELSINSRNIDNKNFVWSTAFNISFMRNELRALQSGVGAMYTRSGFDSNFTEYDYMAIVGSSLGLIYGYEFDGVYQYSDFNTTPDGQLVLKDGITNNLRHTNVAPGVVKYKDQDGDGVITTKDRTAIGNAMPKWYGGITNTFEYKGIDLSVMLQFNYGNDVYNATRLYATQTQSGRTNMLAEVADRWTPTNASNKVPSTKGYVQNDVYSRYVEDGSFLRLKNVTLGYTFPTQWTKKAFISRLRAYVSGQNLFCISGYSGYDPEVSTAGNNPMTPGLDWGAYPTSRVFTFGLEVQF